MRRPAASRPSSGWIRAVPDLGGSDPAGRRTELASRLSAVRGRVDAACAAAGREPSDVQLLPVTKFFPASDVIALVESGAAEFGESREPEAGRKAEEVRATTGRGDLRFHMIGQLQRNKAKTVARWADRVHSVDSTKLATALDRAVGGAREGGDRDGTLEVLIQIGLDDDEAKGRGGVVEGELPALADDIEQSANLRLCGLMVITPLHGSAEAWMAKAAGIHQRFVADHPGAVELSAGMSGDLEIAVEYGSTCVRVGTAIMGERPVISP
ncbi:YggS family pyridoxal phosphate enzyme [Williamsia sp. 1135]|nr:YggS family pyridoxal phosphate enzyme [Williamsia sp. 1135]